MLLSVVGVAAAAAAAAAELLGCALSSFLSSFSVIVEVEGDREKVLVRGPKWVSFNSVNG